MVKQCTKQNSGEVVKNVQEVMSELDRWVAAHGNGQYGPADYQPLRELEIYPDNAIQQVRAEIKEFIEEVVKRGLCGRALEIGIGYYGSTHFLWSLLFEKVITVEKSPERCRAFAHRYSKFCDGLWPTSDDRSGFIFGLSSDPASVRKAYDATLRQLDLLFIDGAHGYDAVLCDWLLYHNLVRKGGLIGFHDCATDDLGQSGVPQFLRKLENGEIDGKKYSLQRIVHSQHIGIAFYECK